MMLASFYILGPIANILVVVEHQILRTRHVMFPLSLAHVVHSAVGLVGVVRNVAIFLFASDFVG